MSNKQQTKAINDRLDKAVEDADRELRRIDWEIAKARAHLTLWETMRESLKRKVKAWRR